MVHGSVLRLWQRIATIVIGAALSACAQRSGDDAATQQLASDVPVFGYQKLHYDGRDDIRTIITDRLERSRNTDPATLSYDPASLRRYNRNSDSLIEITGPTTAKHVSTWRVVMKTNVDIHMSAVGRYEDELVKRDGKWSIAKRTRIE